MWWKILRSFVGNIHPLSSSERILKIGRFEKVIGKSLVASFFLGHGVVIKHMVCIHLTRSELWFGQEQEEILP